MSRGPLYIFDLDGTLCDIQHRRHHVMRPQGDGINMTATQVLENQKWKPNWAQFYKECVNDTPKHAVIHTFRCLAAHSEIWVWSGRSDEVYDETISWLTVHVMRSSIERLELTMRKAGDHTPDDVLKQSWYDKLEVIDKARLIATFDDRDRMVKMWRDLGVTCFQVAPGDF